MKIDFYTKAVLTIIAACLLTLVFRDVPLVDSASAHPKAFHKNYLKQEDKAPVYLAGWIDRAGNHLHFGEVPLPVRNK